MTNQLTQTHFAGAEHQDTDDITTIDLEGAQFADPVGLVSLTTHIVCAALRRQRIELLAPRNPMVVNYLARMDFAAVCRAFEVDVDVDFPPVAARDHGLDLIELQPFNSYETVNQLAQLVFNSLAPHVDGDVTNALYEAVGELGNNVIEHSAGPDRLGMGIIAAQRYQRGSTSEFLMLGVADLGIGLREALARHRPESDAAAVDLAFKQNVTGTDDVHRGNGLHDVHREVLRLQGRVTLRSGSAEVRYAKSTRGLTVVPLSGTIVGVRVPCRPGAA